MPSTRFSYFVLSYNNIHDFHPEARLDLDEIWEFIRGDNLDAADRLIAEILDAIDALPQDRDGGGSDIANLHFVLWYNDTQL